MQRTLILYTSHYGHTDVVAQSLALVLGPARHCTPAGFKEEYRNFDWFVIGGPVYGEALDPDLLRFVAGEASWLREKHVIAFCTCLRVEAGARYLQPLREVLGDAVRWAQPVGGAVYLNRLLEEDFAALQAFCDAAGLPFQDMTRFDAELLMQQALRIKALRDASGRRLSPQELRPLIETFLAEHNTCALSTGFGERVRATPLEYLYYEGALYIFSEGGEKFANILLNRRVAVAIYEPYVSMSKLAGLQLAGEAHIVPIGSPEYIQVLSLKGLEYRRIAALPAALHLLRIQPRRIELLWSPLAERGYDVRQISDLQASAPD